MQFGPSLLVSRFNGGKTRRQTFTVKNSIWAWFYWNVNNVMMHASVLRPWSHIINFDNTQFHYFKKKNTVTIVLQYEVNLALALKCRDVLLLHSSQACCKKGCSAVSCHSNLSQSASRNLNHVTPPWLHPLTEKLLRCSASRRRTRKLQRHNLLTDLL